MHFPVSIIENEAPKTVGGGQDFLVCLLPKGQIELTLKTIELLIHI